MRTWLAMSCGLGLALCAGASAASPAARTCPTDPGTIAARTVSPEAAASVPPDFWTPERMRQAEENTMASSDARIRVVLCRQPKGTSGDPQEYGELTPPIVGPR